MNREKSLSPLTGTNDVTRLAQFSTAKLARDWLRKFGIDVHGEFGDCSTIELYECNRTKLRYFEPRGLAGSPKLYEQLQKLEWYYMEQKWEHQFALQRIDPGAKILEIGAGSGAFVKAARDRGIDAIGIDTNEGAVARAKERGLPVERLDLAGALEAGYQSFSAVCGFQILEHVPDPRTFLADALRLLRPGGRLILCVPSYESSLSYRYNLLDLPPHHATRWCAEAFRSLEMLFPVVLSKVKSEPLAEYHVESYVIANEQIFMSAIGVVCDFSNLYIRPLVLAALRAGLRRFCVGQGLYVELTKIG